MFVRNSIRGALVLTFSTLSLSASPIPELHSTGVDDEGRPVLEGATEAHYVIVIDTSQPDATKVQPIVSYPDTTWEPNNDHSQWIIPPVLGTAGTRRFQTTFQLQGFDLATARIYGKVAVDDQLGGILLNGRPVPQLESPAGKNLVPFQITSGFVDGLNALEFILQDTGGNTGIRVEVISEVCPVATAKPLIDRQPVSVHASFGGHAAFRVDVSCGTSTYQWRFNGHDISGATSYGLSLTNLKQSDAGTYDVRVTNANGETISQPATLTVDDPAPRLSIRWDESNQAAKVTLTGVDGHYYRIEQSDFLGAEAAWSVADDFQLSGTTRELLSAAPTAEQLPHRFFRAYDTGAGAAPAPSTVMIQMERDSLTDGFETDGFFKFDTIPGNSATDLGQSAVFSVVLGTLNGASGPITLANDGPAETDNDQPANSVFTDENQLRILADLGTIARISQINSYSWHEQGKAAPLGTRSPQNYVLYASDGTVPGFSATDPDSPGWVRLGSVDTSPLGWGGQHGVSFQDATGVLGNFRYVMWDATKLPGAGVGTFFGEFDIVAAP